MRIFIYEFVTGGGWYGVDPAQPPGGSLLAEGRAMVEAVARDFLDIKGVDVAALHDVRLSYQPPTSKNGLHKVASGVEGEARFLEQAAVSDFTLVIAPEFDGHLLRKTFAVERLGVKLLSPNAEFVALASDKWRTYQYCLANDFRTPQTWLLDREDPQWPDAPFPLDLKPIDGCGSQGVQLLTSSRDEIDWSDIPGKAIIQAYCPGTPVSIAYLKHDITYWQLRICRQTLSSDGRFRYLGGDTIVSDEQLQRAIHLADAPRVVDSVGYFGMDLILGDAEDGSQDYIIEINPRLTTSYVGLRALSNKNLAQAMLDVVQGADPQLAWKPGRVRWSADGVVEYFEP